MLTATQVDDFRDDEDRHENLDGHTVNDAFYMSPGYAPAVEAGTEFVQFSRPRRWRPLPMPSRRPCPRSEVLRPVV
jgi:hypothetical protein